MARVPVFATGLTGAVATAVRAAAGDVAVLSIDAHTVLRDGKQVVAPDLRADSVAIVDLSRYPPTVVASVDAPGSVVGVPMAVAVAPDQSWAVVTSATRADGGAIVPDDRVSVIDLGCTPPKVMQSLTAGAGATSVRFTPDLTLALVANRKEGTVSIFSIAGKQLAAAGKLDLGNPNANPSGLAVSPDGRVALLSRDGDNMVSVLHIDAGRVTLDPRPLTAGIRPYTLDINPAGTLAAVSNMGRGDGDADCVCLIDLTAAPFRTVAFLTVPSGPEGLKFSPDGRLLAVASQNGTSNAVGTRFYNRHGMLLLFAIDGQSARKVAEAPIGGWSQGIAFSRDGGTILVCNMVERSLSVFRWLDDRLVAGDDLPLSAGPAAIGTGWA